MDAYRLGPVNILFIKKTKNFESTKKDGFKASHAECFTAGPALPTEW